VGTIDGAGRAEAVVEDARLSDILWSVGNECLCAGANGGEMGRKHDDGNDFFVFLRLHFISVREGYRRTRDNDVLFFGFGVWMMASLSD
jgi:hypothetical protein